MLIQGMMRRRLRFSFRRSSLNTGRPHHSILVSHHFHHFSKTRVADFLRPQQQSFATLNRKTNHTVPSQSDATDVGFEYMPIEEVEKLERYCPGGYHPIVIADELHGRYRIVQKLGFGTFSTIWLARDRIYDKYVAIKVSTATSESSEAEMLHLLSAVDLEHRPHAGQAAIPSLLDDFVLDGPNGKHRCLVTAPARMTLAQAQDASNIYLFQLPVARVIAAQLIRAVAFLHSKGVVHGGKLYVADYCSPLTRWRLLDLHAGNVLLCLPNAIHNVSLDQLYEKYGQPSSKPIVRLDDKPLGEGVPAHGVLPIWLGTRSETIFPSEAGILLTDFGESYLPSITSRTYCSTPPALVPPEVHLSPGGLLSFPADIWTLACTIWSIIGHRQLFEAWIPTSDDMIKEYVDALGKLPSELWLKWEARTRWFDEKGVRTSQDPRPLIDRYEYCIQEPRRESGMEEVGSEEKAALLEMLRAMLVYNPQERPVAKDLGEFKWMKEWAVPELERTTFMHEMGGEA